MFKTIFLLLFCLMFCVGLDADTNGPFRVSSDYNDSKSCTAGIQEAIDNLPEGGGTVYVPGGVHIIHEQIILSSKKGSIKLVGAGKATVLRKAAPFAFYLAEDAKKGQDYVIVKGDISNIRLGTQICLADSKNIVTTSRGNYGYRISKIDDNKIFLRHSRFSGLRCGLSVKDNACIANLFHLIHTGGHNIIRDMEIDGNEQTKEMHSKIRKRGFTMAYKTWSGIQGGLVKLQNCWLHDFADGVLISSLIGSEIINCRIYNNYGRGIHIGGGPKILITGNKIYNNGFSGIFFCFGNRKVIITNNHIYGNYDGIGGIGSATQVDYTQDRYCIISNNMIYRNKRSGIGTEQGGHEGVGARDFVITGNIVKDNNLRRSRGVSWKGMPVGISLWNARRCIVANNRCMDGQDKLSRTLAHDAKIGDTVLKLEGERLIMFFDGMWVKITENRKSEVRQVKKCIETKRTLELVKPLIQNYSKGANVTGIKTQTWGIFVGGPKACDNIVMGNICKGNAIGGILWQGNTNVVSNNIGEATKIDEKRSLQENIYPDMNR